MTETYRYAVILYLMKYPLSVIVGVWLAYNTGYQDLAFKVFVFVGVVVVFNVTANIIWNVGSKLMFGFIPGKNDD